MDSDKSGEIDFDEFVKFLYLSQFPQDDYKVAKMVFEGFDKDHDGSLSFDELILVFDQLGVTVEE